MELIDEGTKRMIINKLYMLEKVKENNIIRREMEEVTLPEMKNNNQKFKKKRWMGLRTQYMLQKKRPVNLKR